MRQVDGAVGLSELLAAALLKAVWWDLRLASLLTHLFMHCLCLFGDLLFYLTLICTDRP